MVAGVLVLGCAICIALGAYLSPGRDTLHSFLFHRHRRFFALVYACRVFAKCSFRRHLAEERERFAGMCAGIVAVLVIAVVAAFAASIRAPPCPPPASWRGEPI